MIRIALFTLVVTTLAACVDASRHREAVEDPSGESLTVGTVQKEIHVGMSGAEVAAALGSPNIVSTDEARREVWIYDRISTTYAYSNSNAGILGLVLGFSSSAAGGVLPSAGTSSGASNRSQRTLTVIVKFDEDARVRDFAYHTSRF